MSRIRRIAIIFAWMVWASFAFSQMPAAAVLDCPPDVTQASPLPSGISLTELRMQKVRTASFPELEKVDLRVRTFKSNSDYFRTRFSISRFFLLMKMRYFVEVNPSLFTLSAPEDGVCAILAHELSQFPR